MSPETQPELREMEVHGELQVQLTKPPMRFGTGLHVTVSNGGAVTHHATRIDENGELMFVEYKPNINVKPLLMLSDGLMYALQRALADVPAAPGSDVRAHLSDAIGIRDRLLTLVEERERRRTRGVPVGGGEQ